MVINSTLMSRWKIAWLVLAMMVCLTGCGTGTAGGPGVHQREAALDP